MDVTVFLLLMHAHAKMPFLYNIYGRSRRYKKANAVVNFGHLRMQTQQNINTHMLFLITCP